MKKLLYLSMLLGAILIVGGSKAQAQFSGTVNATIPFQFHAGGMEFPAGAYTIRSISENADTLMEIRTADGHKAALFTAEQASANLLEKKPELTFNQVGNDYVLSKIDDPSDDSAVEVLNPASVGKQQAANGATRQKHIFGFLHL